MWTVQLCSKTYNVHVPYTKAVIPHSTGGWGGTTPSEQRGYAPPTEKHGPAHLCDVCIVRGRSKRRYIPMHLREDSVAGDIPVKSKKTCFYFKDKALVLLLLLLFFCSFLGFTYF